jgi:hypothetical protein
VQSAVSGFAGVLTQHNDLGRTGANLSETILNTSNVKVGTFGKLHALAVTGQVYAQPLYMPSIQTTNGIKNLVFIATEANDVYAYNADSPWDLVWSRTNFEMPWASTACSNTQPLLGISSTPVIDPLSMTMYVTAKTNQGGVFKYMLHALNLTNGADRTGSPIDMSLDGSQHPLTVPGTGDGAPDGGSGITFDPMRQLNRVGLTLSQGVLFVGFASHCDTNNYHGWILRFDTSFSPPKPLAPFVTNPNTGHGGLWMGGAGFSVDANNDLYFVSGDGEKGKTTTDGKQLANAFVRLTTVGPTQTPTVGSWFMPSDVANLDTLDQDLGAAGPLLIPGTNRILGGGKGGIYYLLDRTTMGGFVAGSTPEAAAIQRFAPTATGNWIVGSPIFWNSPAGARIYTWPGGTPLASYAFDLTAQKFTSTTPLAQGTVNPTDPQGGHLSLSANGSLAGTGIVWANHGLASEGNGMPVAGALYAFNAENVAQKLWDSTLVSSDTLTSYAKYTPPTVANGKVYVATFSGEVDVYGLLATPTDAGVRDAAPDLPITTVLHCGGFDGGAPQPTTWTYVYNTYFGPGTAGHCANCHGNAAPGGFSTGTSLAATTKDTFYSGLVAIGQISTTAGTSSALGNPAQSALSWFGPMRTSSAGLLMPQDQQALNPAAVAAVCGWVAAGALDDAANGTACTSGSQCTSGSCVNGFCCNTTCTGTCTACSAAKTGGTNGTCANVTAGTTDARCVAAPPCGNTGACTATGSCALAPTTTSCRAASCATGTATAAANCNGAGACPTAVTSVCTPFICGATACKTTCAADTDCVSGDFCSGTACTAKKTTGGACTATDQCTSGACVDGFCCNTACTGACTACSNAKTGAANGTCANTTAGASDTRCVTAPPCGNTGACSGSGTCAFAPTTTSCRAASCASGTATTAANCNGAGACPTAVTKSCAPFICGATACTISCTTAANCAASAQCTGGLCVACTGTTCLANGAACTAGSQCTTGSCVDGFCCNTTCTGTCTACSAAKTGGTNGTCANVAAGTTDARCVAAPPCGNTGACTASGSCALAPTTTSCRAASCATGTATAAANCNGAGACPTAVTSACTPFICGATACKTTCAADTDCVSGDFCSGTACTAKKTTGSACTTASQCTSAACVDGFCCNSACTGACTACSNAKTGAANGTCAGTTAGATDTRCVAAPPCGNTGTCSGSGSCAVAPATTSCRAASCASGVATAASSCNGTGACPTAVTSSCGLFACGTTACKTTCAADTDCASGDACSGTTCVAKQSNGTACTTATQCSSGACVDGLCCNSACTGACTACSNAKTGAANGTCASTTAGATDTRCVAAPPCGNTGACSGSGACAVAPTTTSCRAASCASSTATAAANCNGAGACPTTVTAACTPYVCGTTACKTTCTTAADCITGDSCTTGVCTAPAATCTAAIAVVDDFEDDNNQIRLLDGRNGPLYTYADTTGSTITPAAGAIFAPTAPGDVTPKFAAHVSGKLSTAATVWAGFGMDFLTPKALYNASKYTGISFYAKKGSSTASSAVRVKVPDRNTDPTGGVCTSCSNDFGSDLTLTTTWTKFTLPFTSLTQQAGWGAPRPAHLDPTGVVAVQFQVTAAGANYDIWLDDVTFTCN